MNKNALRSVIINSLKKQGFSVNGHIVPSKLTKEHFKKIQTHAKKEQVELQKHFLNENFDFVKKYLRNSSEIDPSNIKLELREVKDGSLENILYRWWNLVWWSMPYQRAYGRQLRFLLWDTTHDAPFGIIGLQSPVLKMSVRDNYLKIPPIELDSTVNKSMQAQRVGALPPYNEIIGGKMVAMALTSNELRAVYKKKYLGVKTVLQKRIIKPDLLFISTTSAFGKSSIYNRLKYNNDLIAKSIGFTKGSGTFHISEEIYSELQKFLHRRNIDTNTTFGYGPSRKVKLIDQALGLLDLGQFHYHNIMREFFIFPLVKNLEDVIQRGKKPIYQDRLLADLTEYWKSRWAIKRSSSHSKWSEFSKDEFLAAICRQNKLKI